MSKEPRPDVAAVREPDDATALWSPTVLTTDDGSPALWSPRYGQAFRSQRGAHAEANHVFAAGSGAAARLAAGLTTRVLEVGLGAANNLACTAAAALAAGTPLHYRAWEPEPLPAAALRLAGLGAIAPAPFVAALLAARDAWGALAPGDVRRWRFATVELELIVAPIDRLLDAAFAADAARRLRAARAADGAATTAADAPFDAIYLDPFSPEVNPDPWRPEVLAALAARLAPGGALVSYSVRGSVRRALADAGLDVRKVAGPPGGKREVLHAGRPGGPRDETAGAAG
ncbi:MAG: tRNA (5-methylaminomethyl-2-thiouridine)(34)-methyltransferase MnmD [Trueperaceae bacterium]|nr:tRNA (5-methylaminomethyl-2-thiouridine)(34)-methyltransferase MnmD [Trueperaceae bacterium]